jgi:CubicO group peptidase (beta-lactamase class C family)
MDHAVVGFHEKPHSEGSSQIRFAAHLPMVCRFRSGFVYNIALYGVVGELIRRVCGKSTGAVMKEKIFEPLEQGRHELGGIPPRRERCKRIFVAGQRFTIASQRPGAGGRLGSCWCWGCPQHCERHAHMGQTGHGS